MFSNAPNEGRVPETQPCLPSARFTHVVGLPDDEASWDQFVRQRYFEFLSDTELVLCSLCYSDRYDIVFSNRYSFQATARAWGAMYADWANRIAWQGRRRWNYCDFYAYSHFFVEGGEAWEEAAYSVIEYKTQQDSAVEKKAPELFSDKRERLS
jgi:hypothetical protein